MGTKSPQKNKQTSISLFTSWANAKLSKKILERRIQLTQGEKRFIVLEVLPNKRRKSTFLHTTREPEPQKYHCFHKREQIQKAWESYLSSSLILRTFRWMQIQLDWASQETHCQKPQFPDQPHIRPEKGKEHKNQQLLSATSLKERKNMADKKESELACPSWRCKKKKIVLLM